MEILLNRDVFAKWSLKRHQAVSSKITRIVFRFDNAGFGLFDGVSVAMFFGVCDGFFFGIKHQV